MPTNYRAPVDDFVFLLHDVIAPEAPHAIGDLTREDTREVLQQAARFFEEVWAPLDAPADEQGCRLENGKVSTPDGYASGYAALCEAGWNSATAPEALGGGGLPEAIGQALREFSASASNSLGLYSGLTNGAHATIRRNGEPWMLEHVVPRMIAGRWTGTMCLTEPHCGTDLRLMKTRAVPQADGSYRISGTKIFISGGDHDLSDNVIHLVLAKVPDEAGQLRDDLGTVNLFLVPKFGIDPATGEGTGRNGVDVGGIEHKMGLKGNATCTMYFEDALGWRLGGSTGSGQTSNRSSAGMSGMFEMMNSARLGTGLQAVASAQRAYSHAAGYARERLAGRAADPADRSGGVADPIIAQPDVRRLLLKQASFIEAARALGLYVRQLLEEPDETKRADRVAMGSLLTPVVKAYFSDRSFESANDAMQILGGHGYIRDNGIEQLVRDARIFQLYEGANGVQALDLALRKLRSNDGRAFADFLHRVESTASAPGRHPELQGHAEVLADAAGHVRAAGRWFAAAGRKPYDTGASSYDFLTMMGIFSCGYMWLRMAAVSLEKLRAEPESRFHRRKLELARYWFEREMPMIEALRRRVETGSGCLMGLPAELF
ncbi:MAG TPA: acyl-CoA dehydrogenase C-terminal domain-containing protein [Burkholderiaceae bacterium]|nr:acyl-CoA dehydrogenase C-terminal domain-containing protein [Burkholderiaceae bacterium]